MGHQLLEESRIEAARLEDNLRRELDARKRVDKMLRGYKDQVETSPLVFGRPFLALSQVLKPPPPPPAPGAFCS